LTSRREPGTTQAAAIRKAAEDGSPGTTTSSSSSSSIAWTLTRVPARSNGTRARRRIRSVWSRLRYGSLTDVSPSAVSPAISRHDLTWALAIRSSWATPVSCDPCTVIGASLSSRASMRAPIRCSGSTTRSTGRRRIDSSPSSVQTPRPWPESHPGRIRSSVPALPTWRYPPVASTAASSPTPRITRPSSCSSTPAPSDRTASSVDSVSAACR
jgi:hypothetical protein